jgi:RNA polymerase sigma-70 factor (ECF subfamily)
MSAGDGIIRETVRVSDQSAHEDRRTLARIAAGDRRALEELYGRHGHALLRYLLTLTSDRQLAEELLQDTLMAVWRSAGSFEGRSGVRTWLFGVARRQAHNTLRRPRPTAEGEGEIQSVPSPDAGPEEAVLAGVAPPELAAAMRSLSPLHREALWLAFVQGLPYEEIALTLGAPVGTVKSRLSNARRALRALLEAQEEVER